VLALSVADAAAASVGESIARLAGQGARAFLTASEPPAGVVALPSASGGHPLTDALALVASFYGFVEALSRRRGFDPDRPPHLNKVTETR
jgi:glucosamine--fructose-6-phosphate aminotransferase (isomerizing)